MTTVLRRRRRLLQGLSAASVASALPEFAFRSRAKAQLGLERFENEALKPRIELLSQEPSRFELAFHVQSATTQLVMKRYSIIASYVEYANGETQNLIARIPIEASELSRRRMPPPMPSIRVSAGGEVELGQFSATLASPRGELAMAHFRVQVGPQTLRPAPVQVRA